MTNLAIDLVYDDSGDTAIEILCMQCETVFHPAWDFVPSRRISILPLEKVLEWETQHTCNR